MSEGSSNRRVTALVAVASLLAAPLCAAAPVPEPIVESIDVEVVNVDVVVTDRDGNAVDGLSASDFELFEDGEPREVSNFYAFAEGRLLSETRRVGHQIATTPPGPDESLQRRMAIVFDNNSLVKRDRDQAVDAIERFIMEQFDGTYEWAIVAYDERLQMVQPFTSDKLAVLSALSRLKHLPLPVKRVSGSNSQLLSEDASITRTRQRVRALDQVGPGEVSFEDFEIRQRILDNLQRAKSTSRAMVETMRAYSGLSGRKSMVLVTGILEALPTGAQLVSGDFPGASTRAEKADPLLYTLHADVMKLLGAVVQVANASGFSIYPVSSLGFVASAAPYHEIERQNSPYEAGYDKVPVGADTESAPRILADGTGGKYFSTSKYYEAFDEVDSRTANSYVLGFRTTHQPDRKFHRISVRSRRPGVQVHAREGYLHVTTADRVVESLATPLTFPKERGDIPVQVSVKPPDTSRKQKEYTLTVSGLMPIDEITLVPQGEEAGGRVQLYLAIYDDQGALVDLVRTHQDVHVKSADLGGAPDPSKAASFAMRFKLKPGTYTVSLTMMDEVTTRYGTGLDRVRL
jgi:VWFA-related protein